MLQMNSYIRAETHPFIEIAPLKIKKSTANKLQVWKWQTNYQYFRYS